MVFLNRVQLLAGPQPNVFVISGAKGNQMLVVSEPGFSPPPRSPITVDIKGRIRTLPPLVILRRQWKLSKDQIQSVGRQQAYIAAESIHEQKPGAKKGLSQPDLASTVFASQSAERSLEGGEGSNVYKNSCAPITFRRFFDLL
jgi:hypothetical protein